MTLSTTGYERKIISIVRNLPPERGQQLLAFARFLAFETFQTTDLEFLDDASNDEFDDELTENDERWDALLASDEGQDALEHLVTQARIDIAAGRDTDIIVDSSGELAPQ